MAPSDSRSVNRCGHDHLACKFSINVTVPFRRSGSQEAQAGDVSSLALATKLANSINQSKRLQDTYLPKRAATVRIADEARKRGRQKLRAERPANEKLKLAGRDS